MPQAAKRWIGPVAVEHLPLVERVLAARGLDEARAAVLRTPSLRQLRDPAALPGLEIAAQRLLEALRRRQRVVVYGDYDVDGVAASAILVRLIRALDPEAQVRCHIPHREDEGYGLSSQALRSIARKGADLVVTVDCGVTAVEEARLARSLGLDLVITDHHTPPADPQALPCATAVVHPSLPGAEAGHPELTGAGVAMKLAWRLATLWTGSERVSPPLRELLVDLLALAALGTIADVAPLVEDNWLIARFGLRRMGAERFVGLRALIEASKLDRQAIDETQVGFRLAPRLNAVGRLGHAREALELLLTDDPGHAQELARTLNRLNEQRRAVEREILEQALEQAQARGMASEEAGAVVLADPRWRTGVVGIVCARIVETLRKPCLLLRREGDLLRGSGRSVEGFNLHAALVRCSGHLQRYGGHAMAAGLSLRAADFEAFAEAFQRCAREGLEGVDRRPTVRIDAAASLSELTLSQTRALLDLGPFGPAHPRPTLLLRKVTLAVPPRRMGGRGAHLLLRAAQPPAGGALRLVGWRMGERAGELTTDQPYDVVITPTLNRFNGRTSVEGELLDLRPSTSRATALTG